MADVLGFRDDLRLDERLFDVVEFVGVRQVGGVVDDQVAAIGTVNFDNRSLYLNFETALVMHSAEFSYQVTNMLEDDFGRSERFVYDADKVGVVERFSSRFLRLLSPLL